MKGTSLSNPIRSKQSNRSAFTLIELLVVIAIIAILAAILFPVFAQARERARGIACLSNMKQLGLGLKMYAQDFDESYPRCSFIGMDFNWRNAIFPYVKNIDVYACPSNPAGRRRDGAGSAYAPGGRMPSGYGMNAIATSWVPADWGWNATVLSEATITAPADMILIGEANYWDPTVDMGYGLVGGTCNQNRAYQHFGNPAAANSGTPANWIFADGHAKAMKWKQTILPLDRNMWEVNPARNAGDLTVKADDGNFTFPGANFNDNNAICPRLR